MRIGTTGIVLDQQDNVLLIQRNDSRTFAPPGGALDLNELPNQSVAREVFEETGLSVTPQRLDGLFYWPNGPEGFLSFVFRCAPLSGSLSTSPESLQVGFHNPSKLPRRMADFHRQRVQLSLRHSGARPFWLRQAPSLSTRISYLWLSKVVYRWMDWQRMLHGQPPYQPPPSWQLSAYVVVVDGAGDVLWRQPDAGKPWRLPGGAGRASEAPWETAVRTTHAQTGLQVQLTNLSGVYVGREEPDMTFIFTATTTTPRAGLTAARFLSGTAVDQADALHAAVAASALRDAATVFEYVGEKTAVSPAPQSSPR